MLYNVRYEEIKRRMTAFWEHEPLERCCVAFTVANPVHPVPAPEKYYYEVEKADRINRAYFSGTVNYGEQLNCIFPYFGTAGIAEYTGCNVTYTPETAWFEPWMNDEPDASLITYSHPNDTMDNPASCSVLPVQASQSD